MSDIVSKNFRFSTPFLSGYKELRIPILDKEGASAWPELFPLERINDLKESVGLRHFSAQMMLEFVEIDRARLDPDALHLYDEEFDSRLAKIGDNIITSYSVYWDPSSGRRKADGSVCVLLYRDDKNKKVFIHDVLYLIVADTELYPLARQCDMVIDFMKLHNTRRIAIETNGIGNALPEIMREVSSKRGIYISIQKVVNNRNKATRILDSIEPILTTGRLYAHRKVQSTPLIAEMLGWSPIGTEGHDDGLDALAGCICCDVSPVRPMGQKVTAFTANTQFKL